MRPLLLCLALAISLPGAMMIPTAQGSVVRALSLEDLVGRADHIVVAVPEEKQSRRHDDGRLIVTDVSLRVKQVLKGSSKAEGVVIATRLGGRIDSVALQVPGEATFAIGERVLVFLRRFGPEGGTQQLRVVGMSQGVMPLAKHGTTTMVYPGGGHSALVEQEPTGKLAPAGPALKEPTEMTTLLERISALVAKTPAAETGSTGR